MIRALATIVALACAGCVVADDQPVSAPVAWGDPLADCERFTCAELTDCEMYDEGIVCACVYDDGIARVCELTGDHVLEGK